MTKFALDKMPLFLKQALSYINFREHCTKYNNLFPMAATKVCNYCDVTGCTNRGPGVHCVTLMGRMVHYLRKIYSSTSQSCGLS